MIKNYNKLVRDNIPDIIKNNGGEPIIRILDDSEYKSELEKKLYEEYQNARQRIAFFWLWLGATTPQQAHPCAHKGLELYQRCL